MTATAHVEAQAFLDNDCPHVPVSYNLIVKNNSSGVKRAVDSIYGALFVEGCADECVIVDTGSSPKHLKKIRKLADRFPNLRIIERPDLSIDYKPLCKRYLDDEAYEIYRKRLGFTTGLRSFAEARNAALEESRNDVIFWMDSDDVLVEEIPGALRKVVNRTYEDTECDQIFLEYDYKVAEDGTVLTKQKRERFFRKSLLHWVGACHETAIPRNPGHPGKIAFFEFLKSRIVHNAQAASRASDIRNYLILRHEFVTAQAEGRYTDPRTVYYLGNSARGLGRLHEALRYYKYFDGQTGSADDRFAARYFSGMIYLDPSVKRPLDALDEFFKCVEIKPLDPRGYFGLARAYLCLHRYETCLHWYRVGCAQEMPKYNVFSFDPTHIDYLPHLVAAQAAAELKRYDEACEHVTKAVQARPGLEEAQQAFRQFHMQRAGGKLTESFVNLVRSVNNPGPLTAERLIKGIAEEMNGVPPDLERMGLGKEEPPDPRDARPEIAIVCGPSAPWSWRSREEGIGGSEKMVILVSEALQRTGHVNVSVYAEVPGPDRGIHNGVNWRHWAEFSRKRPREVVVFWRKPTLAAHWPCVTQKRVVWNHDVQRPEAYPEEALDVIDLVQVQSRYHAKPLRGVVPDDKIWIARNAIEEPRIAKDPRDPKKVLYCSSPDRGLLTAIEVFKRAKAKDPELQLFVTYGVPVWARKMFADNPYRFVPDVGRDVSIDEYERACHAGIDSVDGINFGMVGFEKMNYLMQTCGVWLYPTRFWEISCMAAMEAQANGMVPVATRFAALQETISPNAFEALPPLEGGKPISDVWFDHAADVLLKATRVPADDRSRSLIAAEAWARFNIDDLAKNWLSKLGLDSGEGGPAPA